MNFKTALLVPTVVLLAELAGGNVIISPGDLLDLSDASTNLKLIGNADGRAYFAESFYNGTSRTWFEAQEFCQGFGMQLGEIVSSEVYHLLNSTVDPDIRTGSGFWTGARDAHDYSQFVWTQSGAHTSGDFMSWEVHQYLPEFQTCAYFFLPLSGPGKMQIASCTTKTGVLCQS